MHEPLKNCPFCGGAPTTVERPDNIDGTQFFYAIACCCGRYSACAHKMAVRKTPEIAKSDAIAAWNTRTPQPTQAQAGAVPLTDREIELIDGMIQVQLDHANRCDAIANRAMADKQKGWDMERVALLQKFKAHGIKGGQHGADTRSN